ncbi:hypothetical protein [Variovorax paradoxus]|uniref:hypothetical protein n=1 Tax=Variovorax paradoxus TaxID=34073 RepID=UPI00193476AD|nr:hypothetical protein INQ48_18105 [Variovorax paradoxus]
MTCGSCTHWLLQGALAQHGYGECLARPEQERAGRTTSAQNVCRIGKHAPAPRPQEGQLL